MIPTYRRWKTPSVLLLLFLLVGQSEKASNKLLAAAVLTSVQPQRYYRSYLQPIRQWTTTPASLRQITDTVPWTFSRGTRPQVGVFTVAVSSPSNDNDWTSNSTIVPAPTSFRMGKRRQPASKHGQVKKASDRGPGRLIADSRNTKHFMTSFSVTNRNNSSSNKSIFWFNKEMDRMLREGLYNRDIVEKVDNIIWKLVSPHLKPSAPNQLSDFSFDLFTFNTIMLAWARQASTEGAERAHEWLRRLLQMSPHLQADRYSYGTVLNAYAKARTPEAAIAAEKLLQQYVSTTERLTTESLYNAAMDAWANSGHPDAGTRAHALLKQLERNPHVQPTIISYHTCIKAFAKTPGQAAQAQELLERMKNSTTVYPDKMLYTTCIAAWAKVVKDLSNNDPYDQSRVQAVKEICRLLKEMEDEYEETKDENIRPDFFTYTTVLSAQAIPPLELWARMNKIGIQHQSNAAFRNTSIHLQRLAPEKRGREYYGDNSTFDAITSGVEAETLLGQMQKHELQQEGMSSKSNGRASRVDSIKGTTPCKIMYTSAIAVWAQRGTVEAALRAERLLDELQEKWERTRDPNSMPTADTFGAVLTAWVKVASSDRQRQEFAALARDRKHFSIFDRALSLEQRMHKLYERTKSPDLAPSMIIFVTLLRLIPKTRDKTSAVRAKNLLRQMSSYAEQGHIQVRPDTMIYANFLNTVTKSDIMNNLELATHILEEVEAGYDRGMWYLKPNSLLYSAVLQAYAKSSSEKGAMLAENLFERCKKMFREGKLYAKPTVPFYNAVMDAFARSNGGERAAERAESLLFEMLQKSLSEDPSLKPRTRSYNAAILAWKNSNSPDAPQRAEALWKLMKERCGGDAAECRPDIVTMNLLIDVWAKSTQEDAPERAKQLLFYMEDQAAKGVTSLRPDRISWNSCIDAYSRRGAAKEAMEILERMLVSYRQGYSEAKPDRITLSFLRTAWTKSPDHEAEVEMERLEYRLRQLRKELKG